MLLTILLTVTLISYTFAVFLEKIFIRYGKFIDNPVEKSCHIKPTPTAGGLAILFSYSIFIYTLIVLLGANANIFLILLISIIPVAFTGLLDDLKNVNIYIRLLVQFFSATLIIYYFQINNSTYFEINQSTILITILSIILSVWLMNLFNFMDGIDGYASTECIFISFVASILLYLNDSESLMYVYLAGLGAVNIGFIFRNWYPAKIFMGDTGSISIGCILAFFIFYSASESILSIYTWLILLSVFIADSSYTLLVRVVTKKNIFRRHLTHAFHKMTIKENSHLFTVKKMILINLSWVFPMSFLSNIYSDYNIVLAITAYLPLLFILIKIGAGLETVKNS